MNPEKPIYLIYRFDNPDGIKHPTRGNSTYYGWTQQKEMFKAFFKIRSRKLYYHEKYDDVESISDHLDMRSALLDEDLMLDICYLISSVTGKRVIFVSTAEEMVKAENDVIRMFIDATSLTEHEYDIDAIRVFQCLDDKYGSALEYLGYIPKELKTILEESNYNNPMEFSSNDETFIALTDCEIFSMGTIFSFESIIRVLRKEII